MKEDRYKALGWRRFPQPGETVGHMKVNVETTFVAGEKDAGGSRYEMAAMWSTEEMEIEEQLLRIATEIALDTCGDKAFLCQILDRLSAELQT